jgi:NDP-sugar pyrophosphorylase family protein
MYGDNYWPIELEPLWTNHQQLGANVSTTVFSNRNGTGEYGLENNVVVNNEGMVVKYDKKRERDDANGIDIGYFLVAKESLDPDLTGNISFEVDILPKFIKKKQLGAYVTDTQYYYITNMKTLKDFENVAHLNNFLPLPQKYFEV